MNEPPLPKADISLSMIYPQIFKFENLPNAYEIDGKNYYEAGEKYHPTMIMPPCPPINSSLAPGMPERAFAGCWVSLLKVLSSPRLY